MSGRTELLAYLTTSIGTVVALFVLQQIYRSHLDVSYHEEFAARPANAELGALRAEEAQKRGGLAAAKKTLAERGRGASAKIAPQPSADLSAMNGWIHRPSFEPYTPRKPEPATQAPAAVPAEAGPVQEGALPTAPAAEGTAPATEDVPAVEPQPVPEKKPVTGVTVEASGQVPPTRPVRPAVVPDRAAAAPLQAGPKTPAAGR